MAETEDERWRSCKDLGSLGPIVAKYPDELEKVYDLLKDCAKSDDSGMVRYHAVISLGRLCPYIYGKRPDLVFDIANLLLGDGAKEISSNGCGLKDAFDRVRRGTMHALREIVTLPSRRTELPGKIREALSKHLVTETYDIVRMDSCTLMGRVGPPHDRIGERMLQPLDDIVARDVQKGTIHEKLEHFIAKLAHYKLERVPEWKIQLPKDINLFSAKMFIQFEHWSYWPQRECLTRAIVELGPLLTYFPKTLEQVLDLLEQLANDSVFDVRVAACKGLGELVPPIKPTSTVALQRLGEVAWARAEPILQRALKDDNEEVQEAASKALLNKPGVAALRDKANTTQSSFGVAASQSRPGTYMSVSTSTSR